MPNAMRELLQREEGDRVLCPGLFLEANGPGVQGVEADPENQGKTKAAGAGSFPPLWKYGIPGMRRGNKAASFRRSLPGISCHRLHDALLSGLWLSGCADGPLQIYR